MTTVNKTPPGPYLSHLNESEVREQCRELSRRYTRLACAAWDAFRHLHEADELSGAPEKAWQILGDICEELDISSGNVLTSPQESGSSGSAL